MLLTDFETDAPLDSVDPKKIPTALLQGDGSHRVLNYSRRNLRVILVEVIP